MSLVVVVLLLITNKTTSITTTAITINISFYSLVSVLSDESLAFRRNRQLVLGQRIRLRIIFHPDVAQGVNERQQSLLPFRRLQFTLPDGNGVPAHCSQFMLYSHVPLLVPPYLRHPEVTVRLRNLATLRTFNYQFQTFNWWHCYPDFLCKVMRCYKIERRNKYVSSLFLPEFKFEYEIAEVIILEKCVRGCFHSFSRKMEQWCSTQNSNENCINIPF